MSGLTTPLTSRQFHAELRIGGFERGAINVRMVITCMALQFGVGSLQALFRMAHQDYIEGGIE